MGFELLLPAQGFRPPICILPLLRLLLINRPRAGLAFGFCDKIDAFLGPPFYDACLIAFAWGLLNHIERDIVPQGASHFRPLEQGRLLGEFLVDPVQFSPNDSGSKQAHKRHHQY